MSTWIDRRRPLTDRERQRRVPGRGPIPCRIAFLGEAPNVEEVRAIPPQPFVGRSGAELARYLTGDLLPTRDQVYLTNVCQRVPANGSTPTAAEIAEWRPIVTEELRRVRPEVIVALGSTALHWFVPDETVERTHGLAVATWHCATVVGAYHPAAGLHSPELQSLFAYDMQAIAEGLASGFSRPAPAPPTVVFTEFPWQHLPAPAITRRLALDTEGSADHPWCVTVSWRPGYAVLLRPTQRRALRFLQQLIDRAEVVTCHSLLHDLAVLAAMGLRIPDAAIDDTQIMAYLLQLEPQGLKDLSYRHLHAAQEEYLDLIRPAQDALTQAHLITCLATAEGRLQKALLTMLAKIGLEDRHGRPRTAHAIWKGSKFTATLPPPPVATLDQVDRTRAYQYAGRDADLTWQLQPILRAKIDAAGLGAVYDRDRSVLPIVDRMQQVGMPIARDHFWTFLSDLDRDQIANLEAIASLVGRSVNPNSGPQVAALLFQDLGLPAPRKQTKSKSRPSTEDKYLEALRDAHPVVPLILEGREIVKIKSAYCAAILDRTVPDAATGLDLLFPHLRITRVVSGRVSAFDPNVLAIPKHSARGKRIRQGFIAGPDRHLLSTDLSQIELRIAAHECQDPGMVRAFRSGQDIHAALGERIFGIRPADQDESKHRLPMKKVNFGYWMGISAAGMRDQLHAAGARDWTEDRCRELIAEYDRVWPRARAWKDEKIAQARRYGYVTDWLGRRRYLAGVHASDAYIREEAERQAHATPIQAGAQEVFKLWMATIWTDVLVPWQATADPVDDYCEPYLQVHDDFLLIAHDQHIETLTAMVQACIPQCLRVPVTAKTKAARTWGDL